jgi:hypothetical protein
LTQQAKGNTSSLIHLKQGLKKPTIHENEISTTKIKQGLLPRIKQTMNN